MNSAVHPRRRRRLVLAVPLAVLACFAGAGAADAACPSVAATQPFAQFGDTAPYALVPGGGFESGTAAWTLNGASPTAGNESYHVRAATDTRSLTIQTLGTATSPDFCVDESYPTLRFFARKVSGLKGTLKVELLYKDADGVNRVASAGSFSNDNVNFAAWAPTPRIKLGTALPLAKNGGTLHVRVRLRGDKTGAWAVDDVYADPYRS